MNNGLKLADNQFSEGASNKVIVLLADGDCDGTNPNSDGGYVSTLKREGVTVHTIGFTTTNNTLQNIANSTGGKYYTADNADQLAQVFNQIADSLTAWWKTTWATMSRLWDSLCYKWHSYGYQRGKASMESGRR